MSRSGWQFISGNRIQFQRRKKFEPRPDKQSYFYLDRDEWKDMWFIRDTEIKARKGEELKECFDVYESRHPLEVKNVVLPDRDGYGDAGELSSVEPEQDFNELSKLIDKDLNKPEQTDQELLREIYERNKNKTEF